MSCLPAGCRAGVICQLFISTYHCDWKIHSELIVSELSATSPTSASLANRIKQPDSEAEE